MNPSPITLIGTIVSIVTGVALGIVGYSQWRENVHPDDVRLEEFARVIEHVRTNYVTEVSADELVANAMSGMLRGLDDHSSYLDANDYDDLRADTTGSFGGIGIELGLIDHYFTVVSPIDDTPAQRAGLQPGDRLLEIDHEPLKGKTLADVVQVLRGEPASDVHLRIERRPKLEVKPTADEAETPVIAPNVANAKILDVNLSRATISVHSIRSEWLEPGYAYLRISQFQTTTGQDFRGELQKLKKQAAAEATPLRGLVLDLRNNPGGLLQASVAVADALLEKGLIVYTEGRLPSSQLKYRAAAKDEIAGAPIVVLINGGSASASEIVAGALKDHNRATLMGETSFGKGSVQTVVPLNDEQAIKLTTAYYYTPSGKSIHKLGIEPDVAFAPDDSLAETSSDPGAHISDLADVLGPDERYETQIRAKALNFLKTEVHATLALE